LSPAVSWVCKTWYGGTASGYFWGAFAGDRLARVACTFFLGESHEEVGVATEPEFRGRGLGAACSGRLCEEILARGRIPSWTTSPENVASARLARKLGFTFDHFGRLYVVGTNVPEPPQHEAT
ncbi:MAG: GNAT family N-acetyltransferase, partial [Rubrobacter sp.]